MKKLLFLYVVLLFSARIQAQCGNGDAGGTVYLEIPANGANANIYGQRDANEQGLLGITVDLYDSQGNHSTTTTDANGEWLFSNPNFPVRVEFTWTQDWLKSGHGVANTPVRFIAATDCAVDFGLQDPNDYSDTPIPNYVANIKITGDASARTDATIQTIHYQWTGMNENYKTAANNQGTAPAPSDDATIDQIGANWAKTFQKSKQRMFLPTVLWRHASFIQGTDIGNIFVMDYSGSTPQVVGNFDLQGVTPINGGADIDLGFVCRSATCASNSGNTGIAADYIISESSTNIDLDAFTKVAKMGFGGVDMDNNTETLWAINMNQKGILKVDVSGDLASMPNHVSQFLIDNIPGLPSVVGGELRPWAITVHQGRGYLGLVNDGISSQDIHNMSAYVLSFDLQDPMAGFTTEQTIALDYNKDGEDWHPWMETYNPGTNGFWQYYPQPILSDIDFDELGNMYLAFADRFGLQTGFYTGEPISGTTETNEHHRSKGEILKLCKTPTSYDLEGTGTCPGGEFFDDESGDAQNDGSNGALAIIPGSNQLILQIMDPHPSGVTGEDYWTSHGTNTLNTTTGEIENYYTFALGAKPFSGKGVGMGDIEFLTDHAPIQISNRVWDDADEDGIQDPDEAGIQDVSVDLLDNGTVIATATTDADGMVYFSSDPYGTNTANQIYNLPITNNKAYTLQIANATGSNQQAALAGKELTAMHVGEGNNTEKSDSDGLQDNTSAVVNISDTDIPIYGANLNSMDFGFKPAASPLPITISRPLQARLSNGQVVLDWTTSLELNNDGFQLQKSKDGQVWEDLAWVNGLGTNVHGKQYSILDDEPFHGISYYRYIQYDFDGKQSFSPIVNVKLDKKPTISLYPNPSKSEVFLHFDYPKETEIQFAIFNILGEQVNQGVVESNRIDLSQLSKGMYIIQLKDTQGIIGIFRQMHRPN